jgi:hypothetical protein
MSVDVHPRSAERLQFTRPAHRLIVWMLWKEKNGMLFERAIVTVPTLSRKISDEIELYESYYIMCCWAEKHLEIAV